jgi:xylose isomerase
MEDKKSYHSVCRWTFNSGKGGFVPANMRPKMGDDFSTVDFVRLVKEKIAPRMPKWVELGIEAHYDFEVNEESAPAVADALVGSGLYLAMSTPGAHAHFGYGGIASLDPEERKAAEEFGVKAVDITYGPLRKAWHPDVPPAFVLWNGSFGYDIATVGVRQMYANLKESVARLCVHEEEKGGELYVAFEPKPNEGHPAMLIPTVASAIVFWRKLNDDHGITLDKKGVNKEFGHSEMIGLDHVYDTVEEIDNGMLVHMHLNSQGYNDGIILGGPGKFDIDHGARVNGMNIAIAGLIKDAGFNRWKGHDMQPRAYDNEEQAIDRVVRSILSWEACAAAAREITSDGLIKILAKRETAKAEDVMRHVVGAAQNYFDSMYRK